MRRFIQSVSVMRDIYLVFVYTRRDLSLEMDPLSFYHITIFKLFRFNIFDLFIHPTRYLQT